MNRVVLTGRLTADPEIRYTQGNEPLATAKYTLAVDRRGKRNADQSADFIRCVAFGKNGEFAEKYLHKGTKICVEGHIQTGSYKDKDGKTIYTTDVIVDGQEFCESKASTQQQVGVSQKPVTMPGIDGFFTIPDGNDMELPFS